ncbi:hypothetical protein Patl1_29124 [Pistacia atlantica]|uniref:Uncharacterized protein n=1 Tax=Pistacia atlantica TaxID=434234 RepID=A0ACC1BEE8_9ROSI|nr:hypothetical protein Patl1_29124 [Pistacia atlantica]
MFIEILTSVKGIDRNRFRDYLIYFKGKLIFWNWVSSDLSKSLRQINCSFSVVNSLYTWFSYCCLLISVPLILNLFTSGYSLQLLLSVLIV